MSRVAITRQKLDELALHVSAKSGEAMPLTIDGMMDAVDDIHLDDKFIVTIYYTTDSKWNEVPYIPDCTYTELEAAYASGKEIAFRLDQNRKGPVISAYADGYTELYDGKVSAWYSVYVSKYDPESYDGRNNADYSISGSSIQFWWTWSYNDEDGYVGYFGRSTNIWPYGTFGVTNTNIGTGTIILPSYRQCSITMLTLPTSTSTIRGGSNILTIPASTSVRYLNIDSGFNKTQGSYTLSAMPSGTAGTPTATKGTVSNHSVTVTPKVTNTTGYITGSTKTGTAVTVTASELVSGSETKTANGTYDVTNLAELVVNVSGGGGGGASNFVTGTFTTPSSAGASSLTIPYSGSGYPVMAYIVIEGGAYNSSTTAWYSSVQRYAIGVWAMSKSVMTSAPTYTTSGTQNQAVTMSIYKNSTSNSASYTRTSAMNTNTFSSSNASNAASTTIRFKGNTTLSYYTNTSSYGLLPSMTYRYYIVYSS
ncbi:MAG: hypothetical protein K5859_03720 [Atopobiaceae bacterium]|nr:hypothetical protein [Atopobiaceae bacterium]